LFIRRADSTIVVTVRGLLDVQTSSMVERVLTDLLEGQGNLRVLVDLSDASIVEEEALSAFRVPAEQARRLGAAFAVSNLPGVDPLAMDRLGLQNLLEEGKGV
jgi:anti-anti-sigma regulatory factor